MWTDDPGGLMKISETRKSMRFHLLCHPPKEFGFGRVVTCWGNHDERSVNVRPDCGRGGKRPDDP